MVRRMQQGRRQGYQFRIGQDVVMISDPTAYGHVTGFDRDGSVMVQWSGTRTITGVSPDNLRGAPPGWAGQRMQEARGRRRGDDEVPKWKQTELEWQRIRDEYQAKTEPLKAGLVRIRGEQLPIPAPEHGEIIASLYDPRRGNRPVAHFRHYPGFGYGEETGIWMTYFVDPAILPMASVAETRRSTGGWWIYWSDGSENGPFNTRSEAKQYADNWNAQPGRKWTFKIGYVSESMMAEARRGGGGGRKRHLSSMTRENVMWLASELSLQTGGSQPKYIEGGYRWSDPNVSAQFTTHSPEYGQKVVCVVSIFKDGSTAVSYFSDEWLGGGDRYESITHNNYDGLKDLSEMVKDIEWVWKTVDEYAESWGAGQGEVDEAREGKRWILTRVKKDMRTRTPRSGWIAFDTLTGNHGSGVWATKQEAQAEVDCRNGSPLPTLSALPNAPRALPSGLPQLPGAPRPLSPPALPSRRRARR